MKALAAVTVFLAALSAQAAEYHFHWEVPDTSGEFLFTLDSNTGAITWNQSELWVSFQDGMQAAVWGPPTLVGGVVIPGYAMLPTSFLFPDGGAIRFHALTLSATGDRFELPAGASTDAFFVSPDQMADFNANEVRFTINRNSPGALEGPLQHAPEPGTWAMIAGLGLVGFAGWRRWQQAA